MAEKVQARQLMMVQDIDKLPYDPAELKKIVTRLNAKEWAYIVHDKDKSENGGIVKPHVHCVLKFENARVLDKVAKTLKVKPQYLQVWSGRINNAYSYLIHLTSGAVGKHIYDPKEVVASFDFPKRISEITNKVSKQEIKDALNMYANGGLSLLELKTKIGNLAYAKNLDTIKKLDSVLDNQAHKEWLISFEGQQMTVDWYFGKAGIGKTRLALKEAKESGKQYCVLGSSNDYFQDYNAQDHVVILDELRPNDLKYGDLLKIMDPYQHDKHAPRRYKNVALNIEKLIITTPYDPDTFYKRTKISDRKVDTVEQLKRRISNVIEVTPELAKKEFGKNDER
ncbi:Rep family protein [Lactobacillus agrestimuris]|uniref:Rep family protein n=1 Tax=Lactobacillus agrestimuris TaxID=2941328 RepID=UPI00204428AA|nr:Rep family protein [Lactobacillus agrestimuris]